MCRCGAGCRTHLLGRHKGLMSHLEEVHATEHLDEADAVERPLFDREI
jgi:hypothetical protein